MERDELTDWLKCCPVRMRMNSGDWFQVSRPEFALVGDYSVAVLTRENGRLLNRLLALINISEVSELPESAGQN